jgi:hypothetical protein
MLVVIPRAAIAAEHTHAQIGVARSEDYDVLYVGLGSSATVKNGRRL